MILKLMQKCLTLTKLADKHRGTMLEEHGNVYSTL